jgi:hypothetical protein
MFHAEGAAHTNVPLNESRICVTEPERHFLDGAREVTPCDFGSDPNSDSNEGQEKGENLEKTLNFFVSVSGSGS